MKTIWISKGRDLKILPLVFEFEEMSGGVNTRAFLRRYTRHKGWFLTCHELQMEGVPISAKNVFEAYDKAIVHLKSRAAEIMEIGRGILKVLG